MRKLIILEVNEVPFRIYDHYISKYPTSILSKILNDSAQYVTKSTDKGELHPWSTWPTLYRGVDNTVHSIKDIGEDLKGRNEKFPPIWQVITNSGIRAGIFASLHTYPLPEKLAGYDFLIPDPFANGDDTHPSVIKPFQSFNLAMSRKSVRSVDKGIDKASLLRLLLSLPKLGIRLKTMMKVLQHLVSERFSPWKANRRRTFQSVLAFDIYLKQLRKTKPDFTTFFSNHVASAMHRYWAATFPNDYKKNNLPVDWIHTYSGEIDYCLLQLEHMIDDIHKFLKKNPEYKLIIASSMGQSATSADLINHELFLSDFNNFKSCIGIINAEQVPSMHPQYNFKIEQSVIESTSQILSNLKINGEPVKFRVKGQTISLDLGYPNIENIEIHLEEKLYLPEEIGFEIKNIDDQSGGTAYHIPEGSLFVYDIQNPAKSVRKEVDLREVAPSILRNYNIERMEYMKKGTISEIFE